MQDISAVSLWLGASASAEAWDDAMEVKFSDAGDFLGSKFSRAFGIGDYETGSTEAHRHEDPPRDLAGFLSGASYEDVVVDQFSKAGVVPKATDNSLVLLYNHRHQGEIQEWEQDGVSLRFVGAVTYR